MAHDVAVIGGGIIGTALATFLAEAGRSVVLVERDALAAGASGRNSGALQRPFDDALAELHESSLQLYRELAVADPNFHLGREPAGLLLVAPEDERTGVLARQVVRELPGFGAEYVAGDALRRLEPALAPGLVACRLDTGFPVVPSAATLAYGRRAERAGARIILGRAAEAEVQRGRVTAIRLDGGERLVVGAVVVAAGPWSPALVPGWPERSPIAWSYGVVVSTRLRRPPRHVLEELGYDPGAMSEPSFFSLVSAARTSSLGSTFYSSPPNAEAVALRLVEHGRRFVSQLGSAAQVGLRVCIRPVSYDGRPLIGGVPGVEGLYACAGHGPWGLSTGPGSSRLLADVLLGIRPSATIPGDLAASRWPPSDGPPRRVESG
jgi:D-hydroxyproline dehydrogenase subunit beta